MRRTGRPGLNFVITLFSRWRSRGGYPTLALSAAVALAALLAYQWLVAPPPALAATPGLVYSSEDPPDEIELGESFDLEISVAEYSGQGDRGGISVSFPGLTATGGNSPPYDSTQGKVETISYTNGVSMVRYYVKGDQIYKGTDTSTSAADYLLVESDDGNWPSRTGDDYEWRILKLRVTPKQTGEFKVYYRVWLCGDGYQECDRRPRSEHSDQEDQQRRAVNVITVDVTNPVSPTGDFARDPDEDFDTLDAAGNDSPRGIWSDGATMWVVDDGDRKIYGYILNTKARDSAKDFNTLDAAGNDSPTGIWSDGTTMWVADDSDDKIYAYNMATKARVSSKDFNTLDDAENERPTGIWSDGTTMWVADYSDDKIYAYNMDSKARVSSKDFNSLEDAENEGPEGIWSDSATMWVVDYSDEKIYAYNLNTKARVYSKDFDTLEDADNESPAGLWSDRTTMWVADYSDDKIYAYNAPETAVSGANRAPSVTRVSPSTESVSLETGDRQTFRASATDPDNNLKRYEWFVDGQSEDSGVWRLILPTGSVTKDFSHTFSTAGTWTVTATFTDTAGESDSVSWTVPVKDPNRAPSVVRGSPFTESVSLETGDRQAFTANASDPDNNLRGYEWFVGDVFGDAFVWQTPPTSFVSGSFSHTFSTEGTFIVEASFTDTEGLSGSVTWTVTVTTSNRAPSVTPVSPASPVSLMTGDSQAFSVSATDPDSNMTKWKWEVDKRFSLLHGHQEPEETFTATGSITKSFSHTFPHNGTYTVEVTFTDSEGDSGTTEWRVEVVDPPNRAPSVSRVSPGAFDYLPTGDVTFTANANDPDNNLKRYEWFVYDTSEDDGSWLLVLPTGTVTKSYTHTFSTAGKYTVKVTFTDDERLSSSVSWTITAVDPITMELGAAEYTVNEDGGEVDITVTLSASPPQYLSARLRTYDGTAESSSDYRYLFGSAIFTSGTTALTQTFSVTVIDDHIVEATEAFTVELEPGIVGLPSYVSLGRSEATVKVVDDDEATVSFEHNSLNVREAHALFAAEVEVESDTPSVCPVAAPFEVHMSHTAPDGTSSSGSSVPSSVTFQTCQTRLAFNVDIDDLSGTGPGLLTGTTEAVFTLNRVTSAGHGVASRVKIGETSTMTVTIQDDDVVEVRVKSSYRITLEREQVDLCVVTGGYRLARIGSPFTVHFSHTDPDGALSTGSTVPSSVTFNAGDTEQCVIIALGDVAPDPGYATVTFTLDKVTSTGSDVESGVSISSFQSEMKVEVIDRDGPPSGNRTPTITAVSPPTSRPVTLTTGSRQTFEATASDPDDNLKRFEWFVKGQSRHSGALSLTGPATRYYTYTFPTAGNYTVKSTFTDADGESVSATWSVQVSGQSADSVSVTVESSPAGRTVTVDGTDHTTPYTGAWISGSSHTLDAPSPQNALGNRRYVFSRWDHGGAQSQTVSPASDTTYTANFTLQHFMSTRTDPGGIGVPGGGQWYAHISQAAVGPAPSIDGYEFSHWRKGGRNIGTDPAGVSVTVDASFLVEAVYTVSSTDRPPSVSVVAPLASPIVDTGDSQTFEVRATDPDGNISEWAWSVNGQMQGGESLALTGDITRTFTHTFSTAGVHTVRAIFTDTEENSDSVFWTVQADDPPPPSVSIVSPLKTVSLKPGDSQTFEVKATDSDNNLSRWEWSVNGEPGGGQSLLPTGSVTRRFTHTFPDAGNHTVEATFTDRRREADSVAWSVEVDDPITANRAPSVHIVSPSVVVTNYLDSFILFEGNSQTFEARAEDPDDNLSGWEWRVDGQMEDCGGQVHLLQLCDQDDELSSPAARSFTHTFDTPGDHEVEAIFTDTEGATGSVSWPVTVIGLDEIPVPEPPQPSVGPGETDDGKVAYISGVEANRATEAGRDYVTTSLWAINKTSCDYFTAGRPAEENPFMSVKEGLWVRLTITNPSNFPRESPVIMKVTYRNYALNIQRTREASRLYPGCAGLDSYDVEMEPGTTRDVYFRLPGPWFYRGPGSQTGGEGRYEYYLRFQEPFKESPDLVVEVVGDDVEIPAPTLSGTAGSGTLVFWKLPRNDVEVSDWLDEYNGAVALFNVVCTFVPHCQSPFFFIPDPEDLDFYRNRRRALLPTADANIEVASAGNNLTDVRTEWRNRYTNARVCAPATFGAPQACYDESVKMAYDRATAVMEIKAPGSDACPTIESASSDISITSCESRDGHSVTGALWHVHGVGNKIVVNDWYDRDIRIRHQTDIEVTFQVYLQLGPYRGRPQVDPDGGVIDYSAWRSDPDSVYWLVIGADGDAAQVAGGGIQGVYAEDMEIHECGQGNVKVDVVAPTGGDYYVEVFDDYLGRLGLDWDWDSTRSQTHTLAAGQAATMGFDVCPDSMLGIFEFRLYRQPPGSGDFSVVDKVKQSLSPYDDNNDVAISRPEVISGIRDYFSENLTKAEAIALIRLYFGS